MPDGLIYFKVSNISPDLGLCRNFRVINYLTKMDAENKKRDVTCVECGEIIAKDAQECPCGKVA